jgi:tetratricopeptide (TPR) repeat protein
MSASRIIKIGVRVAEWATPHIKKWQHERSLNRSEAERHLEAHNWSEAEKHFRAALEEKHHKAPDRVALLLGLAETERGQARLDDAERTANSALELAGTDKSLRSRVLEAIADLQLDRKGYADAEKSVREAIQLETASAKPDHARLAICSRKLARALEHCDRSAEASEALKTGLTHAEKVFGADHAEIAAHLQELGMLHRRHGDHASAQEHFRKALTVHRTLARVPGADGVDPKAATEALYNLAASLVESGNLEDAAAEYEKMLMLRERQIGANPAETAEAQIRLASLHVRMGRPSSARELILRAIPVLDRRAGPLLDEARETLKAAEELAGRPGNRR